jgi:Autographiviridae endonuclease VII
MPHRDPEKLKAYRATEKFKARHRKQQAEYRKRYPGKVAESLRKWSQDNKEYLRNYSRAWHKENPGKQYWYRIKCVYGLSQETFAAMLSSQGGNCKICNTGLEQPMIDHDHETGKVRGLLCRRCNAFLGYIEKNPGLLEKALEYLECPEPPSSSSATNDPNSSD